jgi:hypothetical protein
MYAGLDACFVKEYNVAVHAHPTPSELLMAREQYLSTSLDDISVSF